MIPPQEIQRAVQLFEQTWWDVVRRNYTSRAAHARMQQDIDRRFSEYHQQSKAFAEQMKKSTAKVMQQAMGMTGAVMQQMKAVQSNLPVSAVRTHGIRLPLPTSIGRRKNTRTSSSASSSSRSRRKPSTTNRSGWRMLL